jgi:hypothetical protein
MPSHCFSPNFHSGLHAAIRKSVIAKAYALVTEEDVDVHDFPMRLTFDERIKRREQRERYQEQLAKASQIKSSKFLIRSWLGLGEKLDDEQEAERVQVSFR